MYSFTLSFFIALITLCDQIMDLHFNTMSARMLLFVSASQWLYGMFISIYLYGRKVQRVGDFGEPEEEEEEDSSDEDENPYNTPSL